MSWGKAAVHTTMETCGEHVMILFKTYPGFPEPLPASWWVSPLLASLQKTEFTCD